MMAEIAISTSERVLLPYLILRNDCLYVRIYVVYVLFLIIQTLNPVILTQI